MGVLERGGRLRSLPWAPLVAVILFVALVAGGLWWGILGGGTDDPPTFEERVRAVDGVSSVTRESDEQRYRATMTGPVRPGRIAHVISGLDKVTDTPQPPGEVVLVVDGITIYHPERVNEVFRDARDGARTIVTALRQPAVTTIEFPSSTSMRVGVAKHRDMLPVAGAVLHTITGLDGTHHGVGWSSSLEVTDGTIDDAGRPRRLQVTMNDLSATTTSVDHLQRVLHRQDAQLLRGDLDGTDEASVTLRAEERPQIATVRKAVLAALPDGSTVSLVVGDLMVSGDGPAPKTLRVVRRMEHAGATVSKIAMDRGDGGTDRMEASVVGGGLAQVEKVLARLGEPGGLPSDAWVDLTFTRYGSNQDAMDLSGPARQLSAYAELVVGMAKANYRVVFDTSESHTSHWPQAVGAVAVHPGGDDSSPAKDLSRQGTRQALIQTLRASGWPGTLVVQVFGLVDGHDSSTADYEGLRFASTADGTAHKVLLPGQLTPADRELPHSSALPFVRQWDATAG